MTRLERSGRRRVLSQRALAGLVCALGLLLLGAGPAAASTVQGVIYRDDDADGQRDAGEAALPGVAVELRQNPPGTLIDSTTSAGDGSYTLTASPGGYDVIA